MIKAKDALIYLVDLLSMATDGRIAISAECLRKSKQNDREVAATMRKFVADIILESAGADGSRLDDEGRRQVIVGYLSLNDDLFDIGAGVDVDSSRQLLLVAARLIFQHLPRFDSLVKLKLQTVDWPVPQKPTADHQGKQKTSDFDEQANIRLLKQQVVTSIDRIETLASRHRSRLSKILESVKHTSGLPAIRLLATLQDRSPITKLQDRQTAADNIMEKASLRASAVDWLTSAATQGRMSLEEMSESKRRRLEASSKGLLDFQSVYNKVCSKLTEMNQWSDLVKKFGDFWSSHSEVMGGSKESKKVISEIIGQETAKLTRKYQSIPVDDVRVDLFSFLVDMKRSKKATPQTQPSRSKGKGEAKAMGDARSIYEEYETWLAEVKEYLAAKGIRIIDLGK